MPLYPGSDESVADDLLDDIISSFFVCLDAFYK
jgi:hypothetical protein